MTHSPHYVGVYTSHRGNMYRKEIDPVRKTTTMVKTTWAEEHAREAKKEER